MSEFFTKLFDGVQPPPDLSPLSEIPLSRKGQLNRHFLLNPCRTAGAVDVWLQQRAAEHDDTKHTVPKLESPMDVSPKMIGKDTVKVLEYQDLLTFCLILVAVYMRITVGLETEKLSLGQTFVDAFTVVAVLQLRYFFSPLVLLFFLDNKEILARNAKEILRNKRNE